MCVVAAQRNWLRLLLLLVVVVVLLVLLSCCKRQEHGNKGRSTVKVLSNPIT